MKTILSAAIGAMLALSMTDASAQTKSADRKVELAIEQQSLADALNDWAKQTGLQLVSPSSQMMNTKLAPPLKGEYSPQGALEELLKGTSLTYEWVSERAVAIREKSPVLPAALQSGENVEEQEAPGVPIARLADDAWSDQRFAANGQATPLANERSSSPREESLEEVVVTGTLIRGARSISPVTTITRDYIDRGGFTNLSQVLQSVPQNYGGGDNEGTQLSPGGSTGNVAFGSSVNLRGLGSGSTLVLVNGHRLAPAGYGQFVDISLVPLSAVERVEVLSDGASATYGSDAVGGVVNIILRNDYDGAETRLMGGSVSSGDMSEYEASQAFGWNWDSGNALLDYEYSHRGNLDANARSYSAGVQDPYDLLPTQQGHRVFAAVRTQATDSLDLAATVLASRRNSDFAAVFADEVSRTDATTEQISGTITSTFKIGGRWLGDVTGVYSKNKTRSVDVTPSSTREFLDEHDLSSLESRFDGPLFEFAAGDVKAALGASYRREGYLDRSADLPRQTRDVTAAFAEFNVPLVGESNARPGLRELQLSLAGRYEHYSDFGSSTDPKFGVLWSPALGLRIRGTYGTSFKAPLFFDLDDSFATAILFNLPDPSAADGTALSMWLSGNRRDLKPELATTWTAGLDWAPASARGLSTSITYFDIDYKDRIVTPLPGLELFGVFAQADVYAPLITRNPDPSTVVALQTALPGGFLNFFGPFDPEDVEAIVDTRRQNLSIERVRGLDFEGSYTLEKTSGTWQFHLASTYLFDFADYITSSAPANDVLSTAYHPVDFRLRGSTTWTRGAWGITGAVNYTDGYENRTVIPAATVSSWTTVDLQLAYQTQAQSGWLSGTRLALTVQNLLDEEPPAMSSPVATFDIGFDPTNANALGRFLSLAVSKSW